MVGEVGRAHVPVDRCGLHSGGWRAVLDPHGRDVLARDGFLGFSTVKSLRLTRCAEVPAQKGVYVVLRRGFVVPRFLERGSGGLFNGRDPNVAISVLQLAWVATAIVLYVGKAGGG